MGFLNNIKFFFLLIFLYRNIVRDTRSRKLQSVGDEDTSKPVYLGKPGRDFEWSHLQQNIQFYEGSAKEGQLNDLTDWLDRML